jgi:hypothetical protein
MAWFNLFSGWMILKVYMIPEFNVPLAIVANNQKPITISKEIPQQIDYTKSQPNSQKQSKECVYRFSTPNTNVGNFCSRTNNIPGMQMFT